MASERRLRSDVFMMFGTKALVTVLNIASSIIVARVLGPEGRGSVAVALALTMLLVQLGTFGLTTANPYFTAQDPGSRRRIISNSLVLSAGIGALLIAVGIGLKLGVPSIVKGLTWTQLILALAAIPTMLAALFLHSVLLGEGRTVAYNMGEAVLAVLTVAAQAIVLIGLDGGVTGALWVMVVTQLVAMLAWLALLSRDGWRLARPDASLAMETLKYAFRVYVATLVAFLLIRIDMLMLNAYLGPEDAGHYSVAVALADGMYLIPTVVAVNLFARVARGLGGEASAEVFRSVALLYGALCLISVALAGLAVRYLYGPQFDEAVPLYYWLAPGVFCLGLINILAQHFAGTGFPKEAVLVWFPGLAINIAINVIWLGSEGAYIASLSSSVAYALVLLLHMRMFARDMGGWGVLRPRLGETVRFVRVALSREAPA